MSKSILVGLVALGLVACGGEAPEAEVAAEAPAAVEAAPAADAAAAPAADAAGVAPEGVDGGKTAVP